MLIYYLPILTTLEAYFEAFCLFLVCLPFGDIKAPYIASYNAKYYFVIFWRFYLTSLLHYVIIYITEAIKPR